MKKYLIIIILLVVLSAVHYLQVNAQFVPFYPLQGGTGASSTPSQGQILIGTSGNVYIPIDVIAGTNITFNTSTDRQLTISATGGGGSGGGVATSSEIFSNGIALFLANESSTLTTFSGLHFNSSTRVLTLNDGTVSSTLIFGAEGKFTSSTAITGWFTNLQVASHTVTGVFTARASSTWPAYKSCPTLETDANGNILCSPDDTSAGAGTGTIVTSTVGSFLSGNLAYFTDHQTLSATSSLNYSTSTGEFAVSSTFAAFKFTPGNSGAATSTLSIGSASSTACVKYRNSNDTGFGWQTVSSTARYVILVIDDTNPCE